jgi:SAM-dependent methyltransferase
VIASDTEMQGLRFQVMKFAGAYGPTAARLDRSLESPAKGRELVDRQSLARAFQGIKDSTRGWMAPMLLGAGVTSLLDLGCGTASLLIELAKIDSRFHGVGVDGDRHMCKLARADARAAGVSRRVKIVCADGRDLESLPDSRAIHASSLLNEFFAEGSSEAIRFLAQLKARFPGRDCWLVDYYGQLGHAPRSTVSAAVTHGMLHDLIQVLSGQGVPPPDLKSWRAIYRRSGVRLVEAHEFKEHGLTWFVHRIRL